MDERLPALRWGARLARAATPFVLLWAARVAQTVVESATGFTVAALFQGQPAVAIGGAGAGLAAWLVAELVASVVLAWALLGGARRLRGEGSAPLDLAAIARPALAFFFVGGAVNLAIALWRRTALGASLVAFLISLVRGAHGAVSAFSVALALTVGVALALAGTIWIRAGLARAIVRGQSYLVALYELAGTLPVRGWPYLLAVLIPGIVAVFASGIASGVVAPFSASPFDPAATELGWATTLVSGSLAALGLAFTQLWSFQALAVLETDAAALGPEFQPIVPAQPIPPPEPILDAAPVADPPDVVDALPVEPKQST